LHPIEEIAKPVVLQEVQPGATWYKDSLSDQRHLGTSKEFSEKRSRISIILYCFLG